MALSRRCLLALQGIAVVLLTLFVLVFIVLVVVLRVSLENCDSNCSETAATDGNDTADGGESSCNGLGPCDSSKETAFYLSVVLLAVFGVAWLIALAGVAYTTCQRQYGYGGNHPAMRHSSRSRKRRNTSTSAEQMALDLQYAPQQQYTRVGRMYYPKHPRPHSGAPGIDAIVLEGSKETLSEASLQGSRPPSTPASPMPPDSPFSPQPSPGAHMVTQ